MRIRSLLLVGLSVMLYYANPHADPGDTIWTRFYGGSNGECAYSIKETPTGEYYIAGCSNSYGNGSIDFYLVKTTSLGDVVWERTYGGDLDDYALAADLTSDGGIVMAGWTKSYGAGGTDFYLIRTDSEGNVLIEETYGGAYDDTATSVIETSDGCFVIAGSTQSFDDGYQSDVYVIKVNPHGGILWTHRSGGVINDGASCIEETSNHGFIITGRTSRMDGNHDIYVEALNSLGQTQWFQAYSPGFDNQGASVIEANDGNYVVAGYTFLSSLNLEAYLMKVEEGGAVIWDRNYGGGLWELGSCVRQTEDSGYILAGSRWRAFLPDTTQFYLAKTDSMGNLQWQNIYGYGRLDEGNKVEITSDGNYILAGYSDAIGFFTVDYCVIKVEGEETTPVADCPIAAPAGYEISTVFPNPFNASTLIEYKVPNSGTVSLIIFNALGQNICTLDKGYRNEGKYQVIWNGSDYASGVYYLTLNANGVAVKRKLTLMK